MRIKLLLMCLAPIFGTLIVFLLINNEVSLRGVRTVNKANRPTPKTFKELLAVRASEVGNLDIALLNLLSAQGLPGAEELIPENCTATLDRWATRVKSETERHLYRFRSNPAEYENSEAYFRMLIMAVVLYEDFGVRYNPERVALPSTANLNDHFFADSRDIFLHGLTGNRRMGTCSSMPVLYAGIGRRLRYPLKLATTKAHVFLRWDGPDEKFDLEATGKGMNRYTDEHFKKWPFPVTDEEVRAEGYLKSLSPPEELALFLSLRGNCLREAGRTKEAAECYAAALRLAPDKNAYRALLADAIPHVRRTRTYVWNTSANSSNLVSTVEASVDGLRSWNTVWNNGTAITSQRRTVYDAANGYRYVTNTSPDNSYSVAITRYGTNVSVTTFAADGSQLSAVSYAYDPHGRQNTITDARTGATIYAYNDADQIVSVTTPDPGTGAQITTKYLDSMGRVWKTTLPDSTSVTNEYYSTGQLKKTYGSRTYPVEYTYDAQGRMKSMMTWKDFANNSGAATTTWNYDLYRGWLTNKTYDGGAAGPVYTYTAAGRLAARAWARGTNTTYSYNQAGDLSTRFYSDGTAGVTNAFDRLGQTVGVTNGANVCEMAYNDAGLLLTERYTGGLLSGVGVTNVYDPLLRRTNVSTLGSSTSYSYDNASRLSQVLSGTNTASYAYLADSPLVSQIAFTNGTALRMTTTKQYDLLNRLTSITNQPSADLAIGYRYAYNNANQRASVTNLESARWVYTYDSLGQVTSGKKYWSDGTPVAGQQFEYAFDDIGNRKTTASGGDEYGLNLRSANYTNNSLNQITSHSVPGYVDVLGSATNTATVTVNNQPTYRHSGYFRAELTGTNPSPLWLGVTNIAVLNNGTNADIVASTTGFVFVAQSPEALGYDTDGNMTNDGRWSLAWDGENLLLKMEGLTNAPAESKRRLTFGYDYRGRRSTKTVESWTGATWVITLSNKFVYDGWNLIAELDATNNAVIRSYVWGLDLSGTMQGAGGVGGLLMVTQPSATNPQHFAGYDGNGNLAMLVSANDGAASANYEYGPFGELVRASGPMAAANSFRFSTKYHDGESDVLYYGYRSYKPNLGRWLNRDPIGERGGIDLYVFTHNDPLGGVDYIGLRRINIILQMRGFDDNTIKVVRAELQRIINECAKQCVKCDKDGKPNHTFSIYTIKTSLDYNAAQRGWREYEDSTRLDVWVGGDNSQMYPGYSNEGSHTSWVGFSKVEEQISGLSVSRDMAIATVIAHEILIHHVLGWGDPRASASPSGTIDQTFGGTVGGSLSGRACKALCEKLKIDK